MDIHEIKGKWAQIKGAVKAQWGKLTDDDIAQIEGDAEKLMGKLEERYGVAREEAKKQLREWKAKIG